MALLFPGQGSQFPGMGKSFYDSFPEIRTIFKSANEILGRDITSTIFYGTEEELRQTTTTQPALYIVNCITFLALQKAIPSLLTNCSSVAGHSLGEYAALFAAGVFDFQTGLKLVKYRSQFIEESCQKCPGTMAAVIGIPREELQKFCSGSDPSEICEMVNFNSPAQIVVAGTIAGIEKLKTKCTAREGSRWIPLSVSGPFHSRFMNEAAQKMSQVVEPVPMQNAIVPVISNFDAKATQDGTAIRQKIARQIDHPVLWEDSIQTMIHLGTDAFIEVGPGKILSGLIRKIDRQKRTLSIEDVASIKKVEGLWTQGEEIHATQR